VAAEMAGLAPGKVQLHSFAWNQRITKYVKAGQLEKVMQLFQQMQQEGMAPNKFTFVQVIKTCAGLGRLEDGRLHEQLIQRGCKSDVFVVSSLVDMYAKCGSIEDPGSENSVTFVGVLNACASVIALEEGRCVHHHIVRSGLESEVFVGCSFIDMYAKCGSVEDTWRVFNKM
jgi:pentatricopeptide repeat protein